MSKTKSTAKLVITSVILSLIVLAIFTLVFLKYIVPVYQITEKQVYDVLVNGVNIKEAISPAPYFSSTESLVP